MSADDDDWMAQANCAGVEPDLMHPTDVKGVIAAKQVCRGCVVREECLKHALSHGEDRGVWGGLSERERRALRRQRRSLVLR